MVFLSTNVFGTTGARAALGAGRAGLVLLAPTRAPELAAWRERAGGVPVEMLPPGADLGELAGRGQAAVAVVAPGGLAEATAAAAAR